MVFAIEGKSVITLEHKDNNKSTVKHIDFNLSTSPNVDKRNFFTQEGLPNEHGTKALTQTFIQGLSANIHYAHENGYRDSAEHLRYVIAELERAFVEVTNIEKSYFKS